jgi:leader peptidase (prepilin peptidase) / N-methyltransferase
MALMVDAPAELALLIQILVFFLGCCLGSFLNVVIYRLPQALSIVSPGSHCPRCKHDVAPYDNIPLLSYLILRGRCRHCGAAISLRYPLIEALAGLLTLFLFRNHGWQAQFFIELLFTYSLLVIFFIDLDTMLIPDIISLSGIAIGLATSFFTPRLTWLDSLLGILLGGGFFYLIAIGYRWWRGQEGLGGGDIKLLAMIGAFLGCPGVVCTILAGSISGTIVGLIVMRRSRQGLTTMLPFGPFLALGALGYLFWGETFVTWYWRTTIPLGP